MNIQKIKLKRNVNILFYIGLLGQFAFTLYIAIYLLASAYNKKWEDWNEHMANGIINGDKIGNFILVFHIILALTITIGGPLQFISFIRKNFKRFHRWNGRIYIFSVIVTAILATYLIWNRPLVIGGHPGLIGNTINAILIIVFGFLTWSTALKKDFISHRKWAIRTYIVVSGVWFYRIMFGTWLLLTGFTAPGINADLTGWFSIILYFGSYLIPLAITESYLYLENSENLKLVKVFTWIIGLLCPLLVAGVIVTTIVFWIK